MATTTYDIRVNSSQAEQSLQRLQKAVQTTTDTFGRLKGALAAIATGGFIASLYNYADAIDDVAKANGLAIETVMGFTKALQANGGEAANAGNAIATFVSNISEAAEGSGPLQNAFRDLGISLNDLATLSEQDLLRKTIRALGEVPDKAEQARKSTQLFGRALKGVELAGFADDLNKYTSSSATNAQAIKTAADASDNFQRALGDFKVQLLAALQPISQLAVNILDSGRAIAFFIDAAIKIGTVVLTFTLLGKAISLIRVAVAALVAGWDALVVGFTTARNLFANFGLIMENLGLVSVAGAFRVLLPLLKQAGEWAVKSIPGLGALAAAYAVLADSIGGAYNKLVDWLGLNKDQKENDSELKRIQARAEAAAKEREELARQAVKLREVQDAFAKRRKEIEQSSTAFAKQNAEVINQINTENQLIGKSKEYADVIRAQEDLYKRSIDEIDKLRQAKSLLNKDELAAGLGKAYDEQITKIQQLTIAEADRIKRSLENANALQRVEQVRLYGIQTQIDQQRQLQGIQDDIAKMSMTEIEKKYYDITAAAKASAKAAIDAEAARIGRPLSAQEQQQYYDIALKGIDAVKQATLDQYNLSRDWGTGWTQAFNDYVENATNAANQARNVFQKATQGMEDMIVNFAKTGKLEWKNFLASIVEQLLRSQIQQTIARVFGSAGDSGAGGSVIWSGIKRLLGFANGGTIPTNNPVIVGERGPELLLGAAGRQVVPNGQFGGSVTYNINAVDAASFKALVARDPAFIYAVTEQGRMTLPGTRR